MVRIPSFARRSDGTDTATDDKNQDGRIDERDRPAGDTRRPQVDDRGPRAGTATATGTATVPDDVDTRRERAERATAERAAAERAADRAEADRLATERERTATERVETERPVIAGPKPRASVLATVGLVLGVVAAMLVLSGVLAGYGIAVGILGLLLSIGGMSATGKRHVAGKSDALFGVILNVGAMVIGALALTGALSWLTTETDTAEQFRQWLDTQFTDRL